MRHVRETPSDERRLVTPLRGEVLLEGLAKLVVEERETLSEDLVLVGELRDDSGVVQQQDQDKERSHHEERRGRIRDPHEVGQNSESISPDGKDEDDGRGEKPEERVTLLKAS